MLVIPAAVPSAVAAYSVIGEREQGTLEPILISPIRREEFLIGKALALLIPTLVVSYTIFGVFLGVAALFAHPAISSAVFAGSHIPVQLLFTPLLAGWSIWVGIAISARSSDVRAAQQLGILANVPLIAVVALMKLQGDPAIGRHRSRPRRRPAGARRARLACGGRDVRPRTTHHRNTHVTPPDPRETSA